MLAIALVVVPACWLVSGVSGGEFQKLQAQTGENALVTSTKASADAVSQRFETWQQNTLATLPFLLAPSEELSDRALQDYLDHQTDFVSIQIFTVPTERSTRLDLMGKAFTTVKDKRFGETPRIKAERNLMRKSRSWLRKAIRESKQAEFLLANPSAEVEIPVVTMAFRKPISGTSRFAWIVINAWQDTLLSYLPKSAEIISHLIALDGTVVASHNKKLSRGGSLRNTPAGKAMNSRQERTGITKIYNSTMMAGFAKIPEFDLAVVTERNLESVMTQTANIESGSLLYVAGFALFALLVGVALSRSIVKQLQPATVLLDEFLKRNFKATGNPHGLIKPIVERLNDLGQILQSKDISTKIDNRLIDVATKGNLASHLRQTLLPQGDIRRRMVTISGYHQPADECGGVLWGHKSLDKDNEFVYMIDDSESGESAAMNLGLFHATIRGWLEDPNRNQALASEPSRFVEDMMEFLRHHPTVTSSLSILSVVLDVKERKLRYCGTGDINLFIVSNSDEDPRPLDMLGDVRSRTLKLELGAKPATARGTSLVSSVVDYHPNDRIVIFSHGLVKTHGADNQPWGYGNLLASLQDHSQMHARDYKDEVLANAFSHFQSRPLADDIAFVSIECLETANTDVGESSAHRPPQGSDFGAFAFTESRMRSPDALIEQAAPPPPRPVAKKHEALTAPAATVEPVTVAQGSLPVPPPMPVMPAEETPRMVIEQPPLDYDEPIGPQPLKVADAAQPAPIMDPWSDGEILQETTPAPVPVQAPPPPPIESIEDRTPEVPEALAEAPSPPVLEVDTPPLPLALNAEPLATPPIPIMAVVEADEADSSVAPEDEILPPTSALHIGQTAPDPLKIDAGSTVEYRANDNSNWDKLPYAGEGTADDPLPAAPQFQGSAPVTMEIALPEIEQAPRKSDFETAATSEFSLDLATGEIAAAKPDFQTMQPEPLEGVEESMGPEPVHDSSEEESQFSDEDLDLTLSDINPEDVEPDTTRNRESPVDQMQETVVEPKKKRRGRYKIKLPSAG